MNPIKFSFKTKSASNLVAALTIVSLLSGGAPLAYADSTSQTSSTDVDAICKQLADANDGKLTDLNGNPLTFTKASCMNENRRKRESPECQATAEQLKAAGETATSSDTLCSRGTTELNQAANTYCTLRELTKNRQAGVYCEAYKSAKRAQNGLTAMLAIDGAAAAVCWVEYASLSAKFATATSTSIQEASKQKGACSYASIGAGLAEIVNIVMANTGSNNHATGEYKIDADGKPVEKDGAFSITKLLDIVGSAGLSLAVIRNGVCQQARGAGDGNINSPGVKKLCGFLASKPLESDSKANEYLNSTKSTKLCSIPQLGLDGKKDEESQKNYAACIKQANIADETKMAAKAAYQVTEKAGKSMAVASDAKLIANGEEGEVVLRRAARTNLQPRMDLTKSSAMMLTALAAIRGVSLAVAGSTEKKAKETLQAMLEAGTNGTPFGLSGMSGFATNIYSQGAGGFSPGGNGGGYSTSAITAGSPESMLLPMGSPLAAAAEKVASQLPRKKLEEAAMSGAGVGGLISSMASGMGMKGDPSEIHSTATSAYASVPSMGSDSYKGGGGRGLASKGGDSSPDLNLKGLFGGAEKEEHAALDGDIAFRGPASDDIWHSKNPKGNNLFQIVSEKYDTVQRKSELAP